MWNQGAFRRLNTGLLCIWAAASLFGCAPKPRFAAGEALLQGEATRLPPPPGSQRAELELTVYQGKRKTTLSAVLSAAPYRAYKLDIFGLPGMMVGSFLWNASHWTLVLHEQEAYRNGQGEQPFLGPVEIGRMSVHDLFSFLWGDFFPGPGDSSRGGLPDSLAPGPQGTFGFKADGMRWTVQLDPATGVVRQARREDSLEIQYLDYRVHDGRPLPRQARISARGATLLDIRVKSLEDNPHWKRDPFVLKVPTMYKELPPQPGEAPRSQAFPAHPAPHPWE